VDFGGSFVVRTKKNAKPVVLSVISPLNNRCIPFPEPCTLWDYLDSAPKQDLIDLMVRIDFMRRKYRGKCKKDSLNVRVVCFWNKEKSRWHSYMTNLSPDQFSAEEIYTLYRFRWEIELLFKELKSDYELGKLISSRDPVVHVNVYSALIRLTISRNMYNEMLTLEKEEERHKFSPHLWAKVLTEKCPDFFSIIHDEIFCSEDTKERQDRLHRTLRYHSKRVVATPLNGSKILHL
jgi:hypothetical protein